MSCILKQTKEGIRAFDSNGNKSKLFEELLNITSENNALNLMALTDSEGFKTIKNQGKDSETTAKDILAYQKLIEAEESKISVQDRLDIIDVMQSKGLVTISELESKLSEVFKPEGVFEVSYDRMVNSGLYTTNEAFEAINNDETLQGIQDIVSKTTSMVLTGENFSVEPLIIDDNVYDTRSKNSFGLFKKVSETDIDTEIQKTVKNSKNRAQFNSNIQNLKIQSVLDKFNTDKEYADSLFRRFSNLKSVDTVEISEGKLIKKTVGSQQATLKNTTIIYADAVELLENIEDYLGLDSDIKSFNIEDTRTLVKEIEKLAVEANIDIIGLSDKSLDRIQEVMEVLRDYVEKSNRGSLGTVDVNNLANVLQDENVDIEKSFIKLPESFDNLQIVKLYSELTPETLFNQFGLIKIGQNLYHRVKNDENIDDLYNRLFLKKVEDKEIEPVDKPSALEKLKQEMSSKDLGIEITNPETAERIAIYKEFFNYESLTNNNIEKELSRLKDFQGDPSFLTTDFIMEFYNYVLNEKLKDSDIYKKVLSKFIFNNKDISITDIDADVINNIENIEYYKELQSYITLKKGDKIRGLLQDNLVEDIYNTERNSVINDENYLQEFQGSITRTGDYIIANSSNDFIKVNGKAYQLVGNNVYSEVLTTKSENYYSLDYRVNIDTDLVYNLEKQAKEVYENNIRQVENLNSLDNIIQDNNTNKKLKEVFTSLHNPIIISKLYTENELEDNINECR